MGVAEKADKASRPQSENVIDVRDSFARSIYELSVPDEEKRTLMQYYGPEALASQRIASMYLGLDKQVAAMGTQTQNMRNKKEASLRSRINPDIWNQAFQKKWGQ